MPPDTQTGLPPLCFEFGGVVWEFEPPATGRHLVDDLVALEWRAPMHWSSPEPKGPALNAAYEAGSLTFFGHELKIDNVDIEVRFAGRRPVTVMDMIEEQMSDYRRGLPPCTDCPRIDEHRHVDARFRAVARRPLELVVDGVALYGWA